MKYKNWPIVIVLVLSFWIRSAKLDQVPSSLYYDEIDLGYQVRSLLQTGKDYRGNLSPFYFRSFNTDRTPLPVFLSSVSVLLFSSPEYQVRATTAFVGALVVLLASIISFQLTGSRLAMVITSLVFAFSPWQVHFSRLAFEAEYLLLFLLTFTTALYQWQKTNSERYFYLSALALGLSVYTYRTASLIAPVLLVTTPLYFFKQFAKMGAKKVSLWFILGLILVLPFLYATTIGSKDQTRISQISIFSDSMTPIEVQRSRELVSGNFQNSTLGQSATLWSKVFHNKVLSYLEKFKSNTFNNFSPNFLFLNGDPNGRHSAKNTGELLFLDVIALIAGVYLFFVHLKDQRYSYLVFLLFLGAVPANLTMDGANHASRLISFSGPLLIIVSLGYYAIVTFITRQKKAKLLLIPLIFTWVFTVLQFCSNYFLQFPIVNSREFGYGFKEAVSKITLLEKDYQHIVLTESNDPPILYYLYWANIPPKDIQQYGTEFGHKVTKGTYLDKVRPYKFEVALCNPESIDQLRSDTLYLVSFQNLPLDFRSPDKDRIPNGIKLLDVIRYPDNEVAFYLITRDTLNGKVIPSSKTQKCK